MRISVLCFDVFSLLFPLGLICTVCLYIYPILLDCSFPPAQDAGSNCSLRGDAIPAQIAPFRLLAFGDPQIEGDTSLPSSDGATFPSLRNVGAKLKDEGPHTLPSSLRTVAKELVRKDIPRFLQRHRKRIDLWGNDLYLAHIYRSVSWWAQPTHTVVLGDLLGSQHISDEEFQRRSDRFWNVVFSGANKVPRGITGVNGRVELLGANHSWKARVIAVAGNHDIGYAGDIDEHRIERFEETFGGVNWEIRFRLEDASSTSFMASDFSTSLLIPPTPELRIIVLNSMNLDGPAQNTALQNQSRDFIAHELYRPTTPSSEYSGSVLLTHIPLHKEAGICVDAPFFNYFPQREGGGVKEQNHLSEASSGYILDGLIGREDQGKAIILNGHDHEGCDTYYYRSAVSSRPDAEESDKASSAWLAKRYQQPKPNTEDETQFGLREITVRSMMGSYGGNAGLLSAWFDRGAQEWRFEYKSCMLGVQHIWWAVHVLDLVVIAVGFASVVALLWEDMTFRTDTFVREDWPKLKGD